MMIHMTESIAQQVARLTAEMRPDWDYHGILAALERSAAKTDALSLTIAVLAAAQAPTNKTPAVIGFAGPHWDRAARPGQIAPVRPADPTVDTSPDCANHPGVKSWACKRCEIRSPKPSDFDARRQAALAEARAQRGA